MTCSLKQTFEKYNLRYGGVPMAKILVIDDDPQVLKLMVAYLTRDGHDITTAGDGKQGIRQLETGQFDLVITDIVMPEQDGLGVLMWLKTQPTRPKIIAISGGSVSLDQDLLLKMASFSADRVLAKPVDFGTLTGAVREVLLGVTGQT